MTTVKLRDIMTDQDRAAVLGLRRAPGQERFLGSMESHFEDAEDEPRAMPRMWSVHDGEQLIGFVMISDNIEDLGDDLVGPYHLWRLLIDEAFQGRGYGAATIDAVVEYLRTRPNADVLWTSCGKSEGGPLPFYLGYGFTLVGDVQFDDDDPAAGPGPVRIVKTMLDSSCPPDRSAIQQTPSRDPFPSLK